MPVFLLNWYLKETNIDHFSDTLRSLWTIAFKTTWHVAVLQPIEIIYSFSIDKAKNQSYDQSTGPNRNRKYHLLCDNDIKEFLGIRI